MALRALTRGWREGWKMAIEAKTGMISRFSTSYSLPCVSSPRGIMISNGAAATRMQSYRSTTLSTASAWCGCSYVRPFSPFSVFPAPQLNMVKSPVSPPAGDRRCFSRTPVNHKLDDFFVSLPPVDEDGNPIYPAVGRSWRAEELRQKSFEDLHKLYIHSLKYDCV
eukprot:585131-Hanusia_phi.AAC.5